MRPRPSPRPAKRTANSVRVSSLVLYFRWELAEEFPEPCVRAGSHILSGSRAVVRPAASSLAASSARAFKTSWDCANRWAHPSSDTSSAWSHPAIRSCSTGGRDDSWEKTSASARVMHPGYGPGDCRTSRCVPTSAQGFRRSLHERRNGFTWRAVREFPDSIEVTAVAHAARDPEYWLKRK
jgi:hypothetical protein